MEDSSKFRDRLHSVMTIKIIIADSNHQTRLNSADSFTIKRFGVDLTEEQEVNPRTSTQESRSGGIPEARCKYRLETAGIMLSPGYCWCLHKPHERAVFALNYSQIPHVNRAEYINFRFVKFHSKWIVLAKEARTIHHHHHRHSRSGVALIRCPLTIDHIYYTPR